MSSTSDCPNLLQLRCMPALATFNSRRPVAWILTDAAFPEILQNILSYFLGIDADYDLSIDHCRVETSSDQCRWPDESLRSTSRGANANLLKDVHWSWKIEVEKILDRIAVVYLFRNIHTRSLRRFDGPEGLRVRRLMLSCVTQHITPPHVQSIITAFSIMPYLEQLRVRFHVYKCQEKNLNVLTLKDVMSSFLRESRLQLLRWSCPSVDILDCISGSKLRRLVLDDAPTYPLVRSPLWRPPVIVLPELLSLQLVLCPRFPPRQPESNILAVLLHAVMPKFSSLSIASAADFPYFMEFLSKFKNSLQHLAIGQRIYNHQPTIAMVPSLPNLRSFALQLSSTFVLLSQPQPSLRVIELCAFAHHTLSATRLRGWTRRTLLRFITFILDVKDRRFPFLREIRLCGVSLGTLRAGRFWRPEEDVTFGYCYRRLMQSKKKVLFASEDGCSLRFIHFFRARANRRRILLELIPELKAALEGDDGICVSS